MRFLVTALILTSLRLWAAENPFLGTWTLNTARSTYSPDPAPKSLTVRFEPEGNRIRRTATGVDAEGKPIVQGGPAGTAFEWDGNDHAVPVPDGPAMSVAVKRVGERRNEVTFKQSGKVTLRVQSVVSQDGKTMTNTVDGIDEKGKTVHIVEVLEKQ